MRTRLLLSLCLVLGAASARAESITVAVATNFLTTAQDIVAVFSAQTGDDVALVHGSTGKLFAQIVAGAPFDVFLSADVARPERLAQNGLVAPGNVRPYAIGHLALVHGASTQSASLDEILSRPGLRIAIADPAIAPYGAAARDVLREFRGPDWDRDLVYGESVGQTFAFVATGNADAGIVAYSQALTYQGELWVLKIPDEIHDPIRQDAALLARAADSPAAQAFFAFLHSDAARELMTAQGYEVPQ